MILFALAVTVACVEILKAPNVLELKPIRKSNDGALPALRENVYTKLSGLTRVKGVRGPGEFCETCISFMVDAINILLNAILNGPLLGECADLCGYLPLQLEAEVCNALCDIVGLEAFIKIITLADIDPIWACEELDQICPISDTAKANITSLSVTPKSGPQGTTFVTNLIFEVVKTMGTGQLILTITPPDPNSTPMGEMYLLIATPPGSYSIQVPCDSGMTNQYESFDAGVYPVNVAICEGMCGSIHSHTYTLANRTVAFTITN